LEKLSFWHGTKKYFCILGVPIVFSPIVYDLSYISDMRVAVTPPNYTCQPAYQNTKLNHTKSFLIIMRREAMKEKALSFT
jgi:hypothetical protein